MLFPLIAGIIYALLFFVHAFFNFKLSNVRSLRNYFSRSVLHFASILVHTLYFHIRAERWFTDLALATGALYVVNILIVLRSLVWPTKFAGNHFDGPRIAWTLWFLYLFRLAPYLAWNHPDMLILHFIVYLNLPIAFWSNITAYSLTLQDDHRITF